MPFFQNRKANIYYEVHGSGPSVLMIAGMSSDSKSWQFILKEMSRHFRLIIFDNRGCGRTVSARETFDLKDMAGDAISLLDHLEYDRVHVAGHSMGGMIAQELVLMQPDRVEKLVLASSSPRLSDHARTLLDDLYDKWENGFDMAEWYRIMFGWLFTREALENKKFMDAAIIFALSYPYPQTLQGFKSQVEAISSFDATDRIRDIHHPTLILSGGQDMLIPPGESKVLMEISGPATFRIIENAAHSIHAEQPAAFAAALKDFF
jgi:pimeloyl-ACP methyl ester carboxylesterase